jgi:hypothetical protein
MDAIKPMKKNVDQPEKAAAPSGPARLADIAIAGAERRPDLAISLKPYTGQDVTIVLREPDVNTLFAATRRAQELVTREPFWEPTLRMAVAQFASCHVAPAVDDPREALAWYRNLASQNRDLFMLLLAHFREAFPAQSSFSAEEAVENSKND